MQRQLSIGQFYDIFFDELNINQSTIVYSLKVTKPKFAFRLMPIRFGNLSTLLFIALPFLGRSPIFRTPFLALVNDKLFEFLNDFGVAVAGIRGALGAHVSRLSMAIESLSIKSSKTSMSSHFGKWNSSCSIGFLSQFPKSSRRNASNNSRLAV